VVSKNLGLCQVFQCHATFADSIMVLETLVIDACCFD
jgi:hypothetical protein